MITLPAMATLDGRRLYGDSDDARLVYLDLLQPTSSQGAEPVRWLPVPPLDGYLVGEVRFGPAAQDFANLAAPPDSRPQPMPWEIGPVYAWVRDGDGVRLVAKGQTSGYGMANAVLNGTAPAAAMSSPVAIAAELTCDAQLGRGRLRATGQAEAVSAALARVGRDATWSATLAEVLLESLRTCLDARHLTLDVDDLPAEAAAELRDLALMELAHRIIVGRGPPLESLARPAAQVERMTAPATLDLRIDWRPRHRITLRVVRALPPGESHAPITEIRANA